MTTTQTLAEDITCRRCGYNLRGLDETGRCPECGTPVGLSTQGDLLRFADPNWLSKLRFGLWLMFIGVLCLIGIRLQNFILPLTIPWTLQPFVYFAFAMINITGIWLLTAPDPAGLAEDQYVTARKVIRITVIVGLVYWAVTLSTLSRTSGAAAPLSPDLRLALRIFTMLIGIVSVIGDAAKFNYLSQLAARIPRNPLVRFARFMMWCAPIVSATSVLVIAVITFTSLPRASTWPFSILIMLQPLAWLIVWILSAILYLRMAIVGRAAHRSAARTWAAAKGAEAR